eukprot:SM000057S18433  [mRNA]  locus=s57:542139:542706:+ [translate_table: standard]
MCARAGKSPGVVARWSPSDCAPFQPVSPQLPHSPPLFLGGLPKTPHHPRHAPPPHAPSQEAAPPRQRQPRPPPRAPPRLRACAAAAPHSVNRAGTGASHLCKGRLQAGWPARQAARGPSIPLRTGSCPVYIHERQAFAVDSRCSLGRATSSLRVLFHEPGQIAQAGTSWGASFCPCHTA